MWSRPVLYWLSLLSGGWPPPWVSDTTIGRIDVNLEVLADPAAVSKRRYWAVRLRLRWPFAVLKMAARTSRLVLTGIGPV